MENKPKLQFDVLMTQKDYLELWVASPGRHLLRCIFVLLAGFSLYEAFHVFADYGFGDATSAIVFHCVNAVIATAAAIALPHLQTRFAFRGPFFMKPRTVLITEEGIHLSSEVFDGRYGWGAFSSVKETKRSFGFLVSPSAALLIPKRCLQTKDEADQLRNLISTCFKGKKRLRA